MKIFSALILSGGTALACLPPANALYGHATKAALILSDAKTLQTFSQMGARNLKSITQEKAGYRLRSTNGCSLLVKLNYTKPTNPAGCPTLTGFTYSEGQNCN